MILEYIERGKEERLNSTSFDTWYNKHIMADDAKNKIEELEKELYAKDFSTPKQEEVFRPKDIAVPSSWDKGGDALQFLEEQSRVGGHHRAMKKLFYISLGFFVVAASVAGFVWWRGGNTISGDNIVVDVVAPVATPGGEPFETKFAIMNNNKVAVESAKLFVEYPSGFYTAVEKKAISRFSRDLGAIVPGKTVTENISTILYGEENTQKDVNVVLEYRMVGSSATLKKEVVSSIRIASSPLQIKLAMDKEATIGQEITMTISLESNSARPVDDLILSAVYPSGFILRNADPKPSYGTNMWDMGTLAPQEKRTITIRGLIEGQEGESKVTKISIGTKSPDNERIIGVVYGNTTETTVLTKPSLGLQFSIDNNTDPDPSVLQGRIVHVELSWRNNTSVQITDTVVEVKLTGEVLNRYSVNPTGGGFYRSVDNTVVWDRTVNNTLAVIDPGAQGVVGFTFSPIPLSVEARNPARNPQIILEAVVRGRTSSGTNANQDVVTRALRTIKVGTDVRLAARGFYHVGPFKNTGPIPPQAEKETTYTIVWTIQNASNNVSNVVVKTTLPIYVKWTNNISPQGEDISYKASGSEVLWNAGSIPSGGSREVSFQISLTPSLSQLDRIPQITGDSFLNGTDNFTKREVSDRRGPVTTNLLSDPQFEQRQAAVVK
ncbi:MAG: hypothetical protein UY07_C0005G0017 [Parcubacteria group bacterium GW2011_GWA1_47_8]|nr:MAG: hypothetical protein UY07_C0005G0017 [Parcubacteria group bacterium GW2011_GWA1_47_8]KKW07975.1 MAG: hypothetical protein UY42_C0002G0024 [Parcubacteria group bacterium GW2011_GWA2_49_16]